MLGSGAHLDQLLGLLLDRLDLLDRLGLCLGQLHGLLVDRRSWLLLHLGKQLGHLSLHWRRIEELGCNLRLSLRLDQVGRLLGSRLVHLVAIGLGELLWRSLLVNAGSLGPGHRCHLR